jgi:hypothetical protein
MKLDRLLTALVAALGLVALILLTLTSASAVTALSDNNRALAAPVFTGNAPADFAVTGTITVADPGGVGDVGVPISAPLGTVSGWDVSAVYFAYDHDTDTMYCGIDCYGICGDADGDGDPNGTSPWVAALGGLDQPDWNNTESVALLIDTDNDYVDLTTGDFDVAVGKQSGGTDISSFGAYQFSGSPTAPASGFGAALTNTTNLFATPNAAAPDLEFSIANFSTLPGFSFTPGNAFTFKILLFLGSLEDDGIGEDYVPGQSGAVTVTIIVPPTAVELLYFRVEEVQGQQVRLAWATAVEIDNFGFNLYRAPVHDFAQAEWVHFEPAAPLNQSGATYAHADLAPSDSTWWYWLADVDTQGKETLSASVSTRIEMNTTLPYRLYLPCVIKGT